MAGSANPSQQPSNREHSSSLMQQESLLPDAASLTAEVRQIVFANPENGWCVARVKTRDEPGLVTIVGSLGELNPGEMLSMTGNWKEHPKFGRQFEVRSFTLAYPASENGIFRYLASGMIKGVGEVTARRMVDRFGAEVLDILDNEPDRLLEIDRIGKKLLAQIKQSWSEQQDIRSLMLFLQTNEVPTTYAARIYKLFGPESIERLKKNPYELAYLIRGIGFRTADAMAMKLGIPADSPQRLEAAIVYVLTQQTERGHVFFPKAKLLDKVLDMLGPMDRAGLDDALRMLWNAKVVHIEDLPEQAVEQAVYLQKFYRYERESVSRLKGLLEHPAPTAVREKVREALPRLESEARLTLSAEQREAVEEACVQKVFIITGGPGTGKTTITRMIVRALADVGLKIKLAAPTGRAAKRLSEATGREAATLHRLLQYTPAEGFKQNEEAKLKADAVIVDEASMIDQPLFVQLLRALPLTCRLILVGDVNQLPSVGPGMVLNDLIASEAIPRAVLTHIFRQAMESCIVVNAHRFNEGKFPVQAEKPPPEADFWWVHKADPLEIRDFIVDLVVNRVPAAYGLDPRRDIQVLTPMHKGEVGTQALNEALQAALNPTGPAISRGRYVLRQGDRVLQLRNNYEKEVFNGDLGWIVEVDPESGELAVDFDGAVVGYESTELDELTPAYAVSIHKSQGSEYPAVIMPVVTQHYVLLERNLLYTGLTRARRLAVVIGSKKAIGIGLSNTDAHKRFTHLQYRLQQAMDDEDMLS
jgi:exodeoxyribonuclease V alpha subunit